MAPASRVQELLDATLSDPDVIDRKKSRNDLQEVIPKIVRQLADTDATRWDVAKATLKCLGAYEKQIMVFISYKTVQKEAAIKLRSILKNYGGQRIQVDYAEGSIKGGEEWQKQIYQKLSGAHWLIVLYPDHVQDGTWVVFETGHFHGSRLAGDKLFCIHRPEERPFEGISRFQNFAAQHDQLFRLLRQMLKEENPVPGLPAINPDVDEENLRSEAQQLERLLQPGPCVWKNCGTYLDLRIDSERGLFNGQDILDAVVEEASNTGEVFGVEEAQGKSLREVTRRIVGRGSNEQWISDLSSLATHKLKGEKLGIPCSSFLADSGAIYKPCLSAVGRQNNTIRLLRIAFVETLSGRPARINVRLLAFQTALRLAFRTRWEMIEPFAFANTPEMVRRARHVQATLEAEAQLDGVMNEELLLDCYQGDDQEQVRRLYKEWHELRCGENSLEAAFDTEDPVMLCSCIRRLRDLNHRYVRLAAHRTPEIVERYWRD